MRVRPFSERETAAGMTCIVAMHDAQTVLTNPHDGTGKPFAFDHSFWSHSAADSHFSDQDVVFAKLGTGVLDNAFQGYNACIFAYGQTGAVVGWGSVVGGLPA